MITLFVLTTLGSNNVANTDIDTPNVAVEPGFEKELSDLINKHSIENNSNTPDFLLAKYLIGCLTVYASATQARDDWYKE